MPSPRRTRVAEPLSVERIVERAVELADQGGLDGLSMRRLGAELGADPMAVYHHVADKATLLALMADRVVAEIVPVVEGPWSDALRGTVLAARRVVLQHPWAARVLVDVVEPGAATLRYVDTVFGILRGGGLSVELTHHAVHLLGSRLLGFSQDLFDDKAAPRPDSAAREEAAARFAQALPHIAEMARAASHEGDLGGCDDDAEFAFALDVVIEGLARRA
ncbi:TetR/AcrR family transcriptional regulator [Oryzobacter telluris]|uniref:TetR/AcrR family transcriptional regulator n=1 Tax=Oryzobacter telluris TaxID=3149179 RepID=UPI00370DDA9F